MLDDLMSDPLRPLGLSDVAALTAPWITRQSWTQWHRRGLLPDPRWSVNGQPVWTALEVRLMLDGMQLHFNVDARTAHRCGRTCPACSRGDVSSTWHERFGGRAPAA
jgi:hypothetical protein